MTHCLFIRHGATSGNREQRYIGCTDEPLCTLGKEQILSLRTQVATPDRLFVSPMLRTRESAALLFPDSYQEIIEDFREIDFGLFEGKTAHELSDCPEYQIWLNRMCLTPIPGGEAVSDFKTRCTKAFTAVMASVPADRTVAFVIHGGVIMSILEAFAIPHKSFYAYHIPNGGCIHAVYRNALLYPLSS